MTDSPAIFLMFGALRSGTTMLRLMLDGHPRITCPGETDFLTDYVKPSPDGGWRYDRDALAADRIFQASAARLPETDEAVPAIAAMIEDLRGEGGGSLVLVAHRGLGRLLDIFPDIQVLHLVRDPRDVARSAIGMGWAGNTYHGAHTWLSTEREWEQCLPRLKPGQSLDLHYETLVQNPEAELEAICTFMGERYDPSMLAYAENSTYERPDPALIEQWRRKQTPQELGLTEPLFGELLTRRGYEPSGHPAIHPTRAQRLALRIENSHIVWRRRIERYGLRDPLLVRLFGRLGLPALARPAQQRIDAITRQHLK